MSTTEGHKVSPAAGPSARLREIARRTAIVLAILLISYAPATGLIKALSRHGQPDEVPRPWPLESWPVNGASQ